MFCTELNISERKILLNVSSSIDNEIDVFEFIKLGIATLLTHTFAFIIVLEFKRYE
jgi:hypothetical protein